MARAKKTQDDAPGGLTHNPFRSLRTAGESSPVPEPTPPDQAEVARGDAPQAGKILVRREKKGRGGKTVTRVAGLGLDEKELADLARDIKRALGCGASAEGGDLLLQGAQTERAADWLRAELGRSVTLGN
jgi:translation initiation factor 1